MVYDKVCLMLLGRQRGGVDNLEPSLTLGPWLVIGDNKVVT
jgi:hypothetical protein